MLKKTFTFLFVFALSTLCFALPQTYRKAKEGLPHPLSELIKELPPLPLVVFLGEQHDHGFAHRIEEELLRLLEREYPGRVALSLEMFERDVQEDLDRYLSGEIPEEEFLRLCRPWPNYERDYRPLILFAKERGIPVSASNVPRPLASRIARQGEEAFSRLSTDEKRWAASRLQHDFPSYRERFLKTLVDIPSAMMKAGGPGMEERLYLAQCFKDSTMAESLQALHKRFPQRVILHVNGSFHSDYHQGTPGALQTLEPALATVVIKVFPPETPTLEAEAFVKEGTLGEIFFQEPRASQPNSTGEGAAPRG